MTNNKKRWFTETRHVDLETGEALSKSRVEREHWIKKGASSTTQDCGAYFLKIYTHEYERSRQTRLFE